MPELPSVLDSSTIVAVERVPMTAAELPEMQEWAYDFHNNEFLRDENGQMYLVKRNEALKIWLFWAVTTARYRWQANSSDYGSEIEKMIGLPVTQAIKSSELERTIREAIKICPYVKRIEYIHLAVEDGLVTVDVKVKSIYPEGWVQISVKV